jgi:hypothetical protein
VTVGVVPVYANGTATFWYGGTGSCAILPTEGNAPLSVYVGDITP